MLKIHIGVFETQGILLAKQTGRPPAGNRNNRSLHSWKPIQYSSSSTKTPNRNGVGWIYYNKLLYYCKDPPLHVRPGVRWTASKIGLKSKIRQIQSNRFRDWPRNPIKDRTDRTTLATKLETQWQRRKKIPVDSSGEGIKGFFHNPRQGRWGWNDSW